MFFKCFYRAHVNHNTLFLCDRKPQRLFTMRETKEKWRKILRYRTICARNSSISNLFSGVRVYWTWKFEHFFWVFYYFEKFFFLISYHRQTKFENPWIILNYWNFFIAFDWETKKVFTEFISTASVWRDIGAADKLNNTDFRQ